MFGVYTPSSVLVRASQGLVDEENFGQRRKYLSHPGFSPERGIYLVAGLDLEKLGHVWMAEGDEGVGKGPMAGWFGNDESRRWPGAQNIPWRSCWMDRIPMYRSKNAKHSPP